MGDNPWCARRRGRRRARTLERLKQAPCFRLLSIRSDAVSNFRSSPVNNQAVIRKDHHVASRPPPLACIAACALALSAVPSRAAPEARIHELAQQEKAPLLDTLRDLVNIESGSKDAEGLARLAALIGERLTRLGGKVEIIEPTDIYRMDDTPEKPGAMVHAEFKGTGTKKIMLIAHMDTVYLRGMLKDQPFRIDGERAYGLAIADDKQGVALILHTVAMLQALKFRDYGTLTVLINGDEEISSPGSRSTITRMAGEHDAVFSYEGGGEDGRLRLATSGIGAAYLTVDGKASHAGSAPDRGVNALSSCPTSCCN